MNPGRLAPLQTPSASDGKRVLQTHSWKCVSTRNPIRKLCILAVSGRAFERLSLFAITVNCIILAMEDPLDFDDTSLRNQIVRRSEPIFTALFTAEMLVKVRSCYGAAAARRHGPVSAFVLSRSHPAVVRCCRVC